MEPLSSAHVQLDGVPRTLDPAKCRGRVPLARRRGGDDGEVIRAGLRLSTTKYDRRRKLWRGRRKWLGINVVCSRGAPSLVYIGWRGGEAAKGAPQVGGILLGRHPIRPPPFHIHPEGEGRRREERRKGEAESLPFISLFSSFLTLVYIGGRERGWSAPFLAH